MRPPHLAFWECPHGLPWGLAYSKAWNKHYHEWSICRSLGEKGCWGGGRGGGSYASWKDPSYFFGVGLGFSLFIRRKFMDVRCPPYTLEKFLWVLYDKPYPLCKLLNRIKKCGLKMRFDSVLLIRGKFMDVRCSPNTLGNLFECFMTSLIHCQLLNPIKEMLFQNEAW
jgi:hypothetical protein